MSDLVTQGVVSLEDNELLRAITIPSLKTDKLLTLLHRKANINSNVYETFLKAMEEQEPLKHLAAEVRAAAPIASDGDDGVMEEAHRAALIKHKCTIEKGLSVTNILPALVSNGVVSLDQNESIRAVATSDEKAKYLYEIVMKRGSKCFLKFKEALLQSEDPFLQQLGRLLGESTDGKQH